MRGGDTERDESNGSQQGANAVCHGDDGRGGQKDGGSGWVEERRHRGEKEGVGARKATGEKESVPLMFCRAGGMSVWVSGRGT